MTIREHTRKVYGSFPCPKHESRTHETILYSPPWLSQPWFYCTICQRKGGFAWRPAWWEANRFETVSACVSLYPGKSNTELEAMLELPESTIKYYLKKYPAIFRAKRRGRENLIFIRKHKYASV